MSLNGDYIISGIMGAGKGTQSKKLADAIPGAVHFESSSVIREFIRTHTAAHDEIGVIIQGYIDKGELVPDEIIIDKIVEPAVSKILEQYPPSIIFDGFPRTVRQAEWLSQKLARYQRKEHARVIHLTLAETPGEEEVEIVKRRAENRLVCTGPEPHTISLDQMSSSGVCPYCESSVEARRDDMDENSRNRRIKEYTENVLPALQCLEQTCNMRTQRVSGLPAREAVFNDIQKALQVMDQEVMREHAQEYRVRI